MEERISEKKKKICNGFSMEYIATLKEAQDGACFKDKFFLLEHSGGCTVYNTNGFAEIGQFCLDKAEKLCPHSNAVCFSSDYFASEDEFPLLYTNVYNNYAQSDDKKIGYCLVYRIQREEHKFSSTLVQILRIGFTDDAEYWYAKNEDRPYGNFIVDSDKQKLYAYVMRKDKTTFLQFALPALCAGEYDNEYGVNVVTLQISDVEERFDLEYFTRIQGATYYEGKLYSLEGMTWTDVKLKVIDLKKKEISCVINFTENGYADEPEAIFAHDKKLYVQFLKDGLYRMEKV